MRLWSVVVLVGGWTETSIGKIYGQTILPKNLNRNCVLWPKYKFPHNNQKKKKN